MSQFYRYLLDAHIVWRRPLRSGLALADRMPEHRKCFPSGAGIRGSGTWPRGRGRLELLPGAVGNCMRLRDPACGLPFDRDPLRLLADPERKLGTFSDEIFVAIRHDQIDLQAGVLIEKGGEKRRDPPCAIGRRQRDAGPREQRVAGVCGGELPRRPRDELDPQPLLQRGDRARGGGLGQPELPALEKLPVSTVRTKRASCWSRSFIRMPHLSYIGRLAGGYAWMTQLSVNCQSLQ